MLTIRGKSHLLDEFIDITWKLDWLEYLFEDKLDDLRWKIVRRSSHWEWKSTRWAQRCADLWNNLGFSLCAVPSVCYMVTISENRKKSKIGVSTNLVYHHWIPEVEFNKNLSLSIIRLVNYSITTSLIYEFLL